MCACVHSVLCAQCKARRTYTCFTCSHSCTMWSTDRACWTRWPQCWACCSRCPHACGNPLHCSSHWRSSVSSASAPPNTTLPSITGKCSQSGSLPCTSQAAAPSARSWMRAVNCVAGTMKASPVWWRCRGPTRYPAWQHKRAGSPNSLWPSKPHSRCWANFAKPRFPCVFVRFFLTSDAQCPCALLHARLPACMVNTRCLGCRYTPLSLRRLEEINEDNRLLYSCPK